MSRPSETIILPRKRVIVILIACLIGILVLFAMAKLRNPKTPDTDPIIPTSSADQVRARIGETFIYQSQVDLAQDALANRLNSDDALLSEQDVIDHLIQQRLLSKDAVKNGLLDDIQTSNRIRMAREQILADQWVQTFLESAVTQDSIRDYYEAERSVWRPQLQIKARQIVLPDQATAMEILRRLNEGESFASLALAYSLDRASRESGGDLGFLNRDMLDPLLSERVFAAADGARLEPFETAQGWHIVEVLSRRAEILPSFDNRRAEIETLLKAKTIESLLQSLKDNTSIERFPRLPNTAPEAE